MGCRFKLPEAALRYGFWAPLSSIIVESLGRSNPEKYGHLGSIHCLLLCYHGSSSLCSRPLWLNHIDIIIPDLQRQENIEPGEASNQHLTSETFSCPAVLFVFIFHFWWERLMVTHHHTYNPRLSMARSSLKCRCTSTLAGSSILTNFTAVSRD